MQYASNNSHQQTLTCPKNHPLLKTENIRRLHGNKVYLDNIYICNGCSGRFSSTDTPCHHCLICSFDICQGCSQINQAQVVKVQDEMKRMTCEKSHPLTASYRLSQMRPGWIKSYSSDIFVCSACSREFDSKTTVSQHCNPCRFDLCPSCYKMSQELSFGCTKNHILYYVSSLKQFNKPRKSYRNNRYTCSDCRNGFDASRSPSSHCSTCSYDLCPPCCNSHQLLIKKNVQKQQQEISYQNIAQKNESKHVPPKEKIQGNNKKELSEEMACIVCLNSARSQLFTPCMHLCTCNGCSDDIVKKRSGCPICRKEIQTTVKVYMS